MLDQFLNTARGLFQTFEIAVGERRVGVLGAHRQIIAFTRRRGPAGQPGGAHRLSLIHI